MDVSFALITEGITDQPTLESILSGYYKEIDSEIEVYVTPIQPRRDKTDQSKQGEHAGWERVFEACSAPEVAIGALENNNFLIVQIDTDAGEHENYGLSLTEFGIELSEDKLIDAAKRVIISKFGDIWDEISERTILAISVHSIECWLLALHATDQQKCAIKNCETKLRFILNRKDLRYEKNYHTYLDLARGFRKPKQLAAAVTRSRSLRLFVEGLPAIANER